MYWVRGTLLLILAFCSGPFLQCWAGLSPAVLDLNVLSKGVGIGSTAIHFGPACAQIMPRLLGFDHRPMASRVAVGKLWQANMIKTI